MAKLLGKLSWFSQFITQSQILSHELRPCQLTIQVYKYATENIFQQTIIIQSKCEHFPPQKDFHIWYLELLGTTTCKWIVQQLSYIHTISVNALYIYSYTVTNYEDSNITNVCNGM